MYKLFINNLQVGNYNTMKEMFGSALSVYCFGKFTKRMKWEGKKLFITLYEKWELKG